MQETNVSETKKDDLIVVTGAGGFIAGALVKYFADRGFTRIRAVDKKPLPEWYQRIPGVECLCLDLSNEEYCRRVCEEAAEVYNLAADMGGRSSPATSTSWRAAKLPEHDVNSWADFNMKIDVQHSAEALDDASGILGAGDWMMVHTMTSRPPLRP